MLPRICLLVLLGLSAGAAEVTVLDSNDYARIDEALRVLNCTREDAGFHKDVVTNLLHEWELVRGVLDDPFALDGLAESLVEEALGGQPSLLGAPTVWMFLDSVSPDFDAGTPAGVRAGIRTNRFDPALDRLGDEFADQVREVAARLREEEARLPPLDEDTRVGLSSMLFSQFDTVGYREMQTLLRPLGLGDHPRLVDERALLDPTPAVETRLDAGRAFALKQQWFEIPDASALRTVAATVTNWPPEPVEVAPGVWIGSTNDDHYAEAFTLLVEPGGNDRYTGFAGAATPSNRTSLLVELAGDDLYDSRELVGAGGAVAGLAVLIDFAGDDIHRAAHMGQGAAICGNAHLEDHAGDDIYIAGSFAQGAAAHGIARLEDRAGADTYRVGQCGQAYAGVRGVGTLIDRSGDDTYKAGGLSAVPWYRGQTFSMAQGFAIGERPFVGGGVAALIDLEGNDTYRTEVYGQGCSYWYSLGMLFDQAGNDSYTMFHYGQGSGIHLSAGLLVDGAGKDTYTAGEGLAQGNAHDYAVGWLIDRGDGRDQYTADHFAQGRGMNNSFGMLIDQGGTDSYYARVLSRAQGIGDDGRYREYGSLALLLDYGGIDNYSLDIENGQSRRRPDHGVVFDWE